VEVRAETKGENISLEIEGFSKQILKKWTQRAYFYQLLARVQKSLKAEF